MPEQHRTNDQEYPATSDRRFSELPLADRWRLVKEALVEVYQPEYRWHRLSPVPWLSPVRVISHPAFILCVVSVLILAIARYTSIPVSASFKLWVGCQLFLIFSLFLAAWFFEDKSRKYLAKIANDLSEFEQKTLQPGQHE